MSIRFALLNTEPRHESRLKERVDSCSPVVLFRRLPWLVERVLVENTHFVKDRSLGGGLGLSLELATQVCYSQLDQVPLSCGPGRAGWRLFDHPPPPLSQSPAAVYDHDVSRQVVRFVRSQVYRGSRNVSGLTDSFQGGAVDDHRTEGVVLDEHLRELGFD